MKVCPYCRTENHDEAIICKACGKGISKKALVGEKLNAVADIVKGCGCLLTILGVIVFIIVVWILLK